MTTITLKYIRHDVAGFVVWPKGLECAAHRDVARGLELSRDVCHGRLVSAGFVDMEDGLPRCYGRSESLNLNSMNCDTAALRKEWGMAAPKPTSAINQVQAVATVVEQLEDNEARIRWMFNPVPDGAELLWDHGGLLVPAPLPPASMAAAERFGAEQPCESIEAGDPT